MSAERRLSSLVIEEMIAFCFSHFGFLFVMLLDGSLAIGEKGDGGYNSEHTKV